MPDPESCHAVRFGFWVFKFRIARPVSCRLATHTGLARVLHTLGFVNHRLGPALQSGRNLANPIDPAAPTRSDAVQSSLKAPTAMSLKLVTIPCRTDNYAFLIHDEATGATAVVDAPEAAPILAALTAQGWHLSQILITHHHSDHIDGVADLVAATGAKVVGSRADAHRLPRLAHQVSEGDSISVGAEIGRVIDVPGHTVGHIAFHFPDSALVFTADSLMAGGCGRLFEGSPAQMWHSLQKLAALPGETLVCSGHEYTTSNLRFAATIEPDNAALIARIANVAAARVEGQPTVPSRLSNEMATNPFLRASLPHIKQRVGLQHATDIEAFAEIRSRKDRF